MGSCMKILLWVAILTLGFGAPHTAYASIASYVKQICERLPIHTTAPRTAGDNGFRIIIEGLPTADAYRPGETYTVIVNGSSPNQRLMGLMIEATATDKKGNVYNPGSFNTSLDGRVQDLKDDNTCERSVISHRYLVNKNGVKFSWTAPVPGAGCLHFNATVIEHSDVWYKDEGRLHRVICEDISDNDWASALSNDLPSQGEGDCCACGHAMYTVEFKGLWSRNTHPKDFPDEKNAFQLHWSNIVGATHGSDYRIWEYGQFASKAVKEVCEYGSSKSLENDMKENSDRIRTVIKTNQMWGPDAIQDSVKAVYTVNRMKPLLSLLTMIGPSPDWCLGVSGQSMCTTNCTWVENLDIDLYPWDAGTDSRVSYIGRKTPTEPPERIHRLTSTYPNNMDSPFYGVDIKPFARLTITKNKEACTDDDGKSNSAENSPSTEELVSMMKKKMMMKKKLEMEKCATSQWSEWSDCSNPCGNGLRERRRILKSTGITPDMCGLNLMETEPCVGDCKESRRKPLPDHFLMRPTDERDPSDACTVTGWSEWSACSATCGLGMKERWRMFLQNTEKRVDCGIHLMEKDLCRGDVFDCTKAMMMKNFTALCQLPLDGGPCRGDFPRWFYNHTLEKCQVFSYGGCKGNENRFETEEECVDLCAEHMADILRKEQILIKQDIMNKQMEMEKQLLVEKQRMLAEQRMVEKQKTMEEDMRRKELLMQKQKMMQQKETLNADDLKSTMLKQQMQQSQGQADTTLNTGGDNADDTSDTKRKQQKLQRKKERMERRRRKRLRQKKKQQELDEDEDGDYVIVQNGRGAAVDCVVTSWSEWSECSVTCGKGVIMKTRMIKVQPQNGGRICPKRLIRKKKCRQKKCLNCVMDEWSQWSPCSETCGDSSVQIRKRRRLQKPRHGGQACPAKKEKKFCNVPMCTGPQMEESMRRYMMFHRRY
ncbi:hypothetical protein BsWGS_12325 [Bradybaena similaris]